MTEIVTEASKPFYATVGLGSLAVEQARDLSKTVPAEISKLQEQASKGLPDFKSVQSQLKTFPAELSKLPTTVKTQFETYSTKGQEFYVDLVNRGEKLVKTIRRQPATQVTVANLKNVETTLEATAQSVKPTAKATTDSVKKATTPKA